jgi:hypothetical protein
VFPIRSWLKLNKMTIQPLLFVIAILLVLIFWEMSKINSHLKEGASHRNGMGEGRPRESIQTLTTCENSSARAAVRVSRQGHGWLSKTSVRDEPSGRAWFARPPVSGQAVSWIALKPFVGSSGCIHLESWRGFLRGAGWVECEQFRVSKGLHHENATVDFRSRFPFGYGGPFSRWSISLVKSEIRAFY